MTAGVVYTERLGRRLAFVFVALLVIVAAAGFAAGLIVAGLVGS